MNTQQQYLAPDIFSITRRVKQPVTRKYKITFPCGSTWEFDRHDLEIPMFTDGDQTGVTNCYDTLKEALADLPSYGKVERI